MSKNLTVREFVELLGGNDRASKLFGVTIPAVCNWKTGNRFPAWALPRATGLASEHGVTFSARSVKTKRPPGARAPTASAAE